MNKHFKMKTLGTWILRLCKSAELEKLLKMFESESLRRKHTTKRYVSVSLCVWIVNNVLAEIQHLPTS